MHINFRYYNRFLIKLFFGVIIFSLGNYANALSLKNDNIIQNKDFLYTVTQGSKILESNYLKKELPDPSPSFPMPKMSQGDIEKYVAKHGNAMPKTWGKCLVSSKTYKDLELKTIGTQLTCEKKAGCEGYIVFYRNNRNNIRNHNKFSFDVHDNINNTNNAFTIVEESNTLLNEVYYKYLDGKYYREGFNPVEPRNSTDGSYSFWEYYKANYGEAIVYIPLNAAPQEVAGFYLGYNASDKADFPTEIISNDGSKEKLKYYTLWQLKGLNQLGPNITFAQTFQVSHGLTTTDMYSWAGQLNMGYGNPMMDIPLIQGGITYTSSHSVAVQDSTMIPETATFPPRPYNTIDAIYTLDLVSKTIAPQLEKFMDNVNNAISQGNTNSSALFKWELVKKTNSDEYDNAVDAKTENTNFINAEISVKAQEKS